MRVRCVYYDDDVFVHDASRVRLDGKDVGMRLFITGKWVEEKEVDAYCICKCR